MDATRPDGSSTAKLAFMRIFGMLFPTIYRPSRDWWDRLVVSGKNRWGRKLFDWFWNKSYTSRIGGKYEKSANAKLLQPDILRYELLAVFKLTQPNHFPSLFWSNSGLSLVHNSDQVVMDAIHKGEMIHVARNGIASMKGNTLHLTDGTSVDADAVIFGTGWKEPGSSMFTPEMTAKLGLPVPWDTLPEKTARQWKELLAAEDQKIVELYPLLEIPPYDLPDRHKADTPFLLFRGTLCLISLTSSKCTINEDDTNGTFTQDSYHQLSTQNARTSCSSAK